ncbi:hypothetical protein GNY06_12260 [Elizabethkingia argentiflava]|uniref:GTP-binding protein n=1 Tax=Elizabethkingia argenteiflava TaxID=2681556 RepID=A0A845PYX7_9FLAO|nr:hypothetical protein [Elizabethkingia argenteiflava]NAW52111.1 hypothetical protein [Elizabethkingia argenteiflava]
MEETLLNNIRNRPRFKFVSQFSASDCEIYLQKRLKANPTIGGKINREVATLWVNNQRDAYWKPYLSIRIESSEETQGYTHLHCIVGPSSSVWTFFMFLYFIFGIFFMIFISLYYVELKIKTENYPWALYISVICLLLIFLTWMASQIGQNLAKEEMQMLRKFVESISEYLSIKQET